MREILFRAKRKNWRELPKEEWWVEGYYCYFMNEHCILPKNLDADAALFGEQKVFVTIDPETLCQYTGLTDKNGKRIWENDIIQCGTNLRVSWHTFKASYVVSRKGWLYNHFFGESVEPEDVEVIGNSIDTPELLRGKNEQMA